MKNRIVCLLCTLAAALLALGSIQGCGVSGVPTPLSPSSSVLSPAIYFTPTLPSTWTPRPPTPTNTRVIPIPPTSTPGPSPTPTRLSARSKALVVGLQDSRTVEVVIDGQPLSQIYVVRLLGVEPPSLSNAWAGIAVEWLAQEVGRRVVVLESDKQERDAQGNLLRYVWREGRMVNVTMVYLGLATTSEDVASLDYGDDLLDALADAQDARRGLWGPPPTPTPPSLTPTATLTVTQSATTTIVTTQTTVPAPTPASMN
jgi:endonuclease YncB( thermonuclease family)